jgi:hypothetical protein
MACIMQHRNLGQCNGNFYIEDNFNSCQGYYLCSERSPEQ